jgi:hypothetical protein
MRQVGGGVWGGEGVGGPEDLYLGAPRVSM